MMKTTIRQKLFLFSLVVVAGNGVLGYAVYKSNQKQVDAEKWVQHTEQVISLSAKILSTSKDIETATDGFVITEHKSFLQPLYGAKKTISNNVGQLRKLTTDNPAQQKRIDSLDFYMQAYLDFSLKTVEIRRKQQSGPAMAYTSVIQGKVFTDHIRLVTAAIQQEESALLAQRRIINDASVVLFDRFSKAMFISLAGFTILLLIVIGKYLGQNIDKGKRAGELMIANEELSFQNEEKGKRADELIIANKELAFQNKEKGKRAEELIVANKELAFQNDEKEKRAAELIIANKELAFQNDEKGKRAEELIIANKELAFQNDEKGKRAAELVIANEELLFQNGEKGKRATELTIANTELLFQSEEKGKRAAELTIANKELVFQNKEKGKRAAELTIANEERAKMVSDLVLRNSDLEQFAYIISHNLRAPVANIIGASTALNDSELSIEDKEMLHRGIGVSVMRLDDVVNDLNQILQIKGDVNEIKEMVHFSVLVDDIKFSIQNLIDKYGFEIKYDFSEVDVFLTLRAYLYSIFYNLISNSIKYRRQQVDSFIEIKSTLEKNRLLLVFKDNGTGIDLKKNGGDIFGLYKRFHTHIEGKGMGLFMVKTQVETLGGKINVKSTENGGAEFRIEFAV